MTDFLSVILTCFCLYVFSSALFLINSVGKKEGRMASNLYL